MSLRDLSNLNISLGSQRQEVVISKRAERLEDFIKKNKLKELTKDQINTLDYNQLGWVLDPNNKQTGDFKTFAYDSKMATLKQILDSQKKLEIKSGVKCPRCGGSNTVPMGAKQTTIGLDEQMKRQFRCNSCTDNNTFYI